MAAVYLEWKKVKVHTPLDSPQSSLFPVFSAFCAKRGLDPSTHSLFTQPKGRTPGARVDMSVNWGMLGLNTNCVLEVLQCGADAGAAAGPASGGGEVRLALDGESGRYITSVPSGTTLRDVVLAGIASGTLTGVVAARAPHLRGVSLVYLRSAIPSLATTLAAIGLRGGSASFKLVCSAVEPPPEEGLAGGQDEAPGMDSAAPAAAAAAVEAAAPQQQPQDLPSPAPQQPLQPETRPAISFLPAAAPSATSATASSSAAVAAAAAAPAQQQPFINFLSSSSSSTYSAAASAAAAAPAPLPAAGAGQDARVRTATARARAGLADVLSNNYDSTSAQVLARLLRLLDNLLLQPSNPTVRSLRRGNPAFEAALGAHEGALEVLRAVGFEDASESSGASFLRLALERSECPACTRAVRRAVAEEARALGVPADAEPPAEGRAGGSAAGDAGAGALAAPGPLPGAGEAAALAEQLAREREARLARAAERAAADARSSAAAAAEEAAVRARAAAAMAAWAEASQSRDAAGGSSSSSSSSSMNSTVLSRVGGSGSGGSGSEGSPLQTKTERRVAELRSRARDIMRSAQPVARGTQVSVFDPQQQGSAASSSASASAGGRGMEEEEDDPEARRIQLEYYAAKLKREAEEAERVRFFFRPIFSLVLALALTHSRPHPPARAQGLRTRAMAELEALEKSSVFVTTVIRVQFPDRLLVQASFSPLETLSSVYEWVGSLLAPQQVGGEGSGQGMAVEGWERGGQQPPPFYLFTAPPHTPHLLPAAALACAAAAPATPRAPPPPQEDPTLQDRKFTPLQLLHCGWGAHPRARAPPPPQGTFALLTPAAQALAAAAPQAVLPTALPLLQSSAAPVGEAVLSAMAGALLSGEGMSLAGLVAAQGAEGGGAGRAGPGDERAAKLLKLMQRK